MVKNVNPIKIGIMANVHVSVKIRKNIACAKKDHISNLATCTCENGRYVGTIINDPVNTCDEIIDLTKGTLTKAVLTKSTSTKSNTKKIL